MAKVPNWLAALLGGEGKIPRSKTVYWGWKEVNFVAWDQKDVRNY